MAIVDELHRLIGLEDFDLHAAMGLVVAALKERDDAVRCLEETNAAWSDKVDKLTERLASLESRVAGTEAAASKQESLAVDINERRRYSEVIEKVMLGAIIVVDQRGAGTFVDIPSALDVARTGDTIVVRPGVYSEPLVLATPGVTVRGVSAETTILQHQADVCSVVYRATATVSQLSIHGAGPHNSAVRFEGGDGVMEHCIVTSMNLTCVVVSAGSPSISHCTISGSKQHGICCKKNTTPRISHCDIHTNKQPNVVVDQGAAPLLEHCTIHSSGQNGVWFRNGSSGVIEDSSIFDNTFSNIDISATADPIIRRNKIYGSEKCGVCVADNAVGTVEANEIYSNTYSNVGVMAGATPTVRGNTIFSSKQHGILIKSGAAGMIVQNALHSNELANIKLEQGAKTVVENNTR
eukprot:TRINITY_DN15108_c0_g1_i1.p1 TRINITY_DN15108_c0_g1~~TRINITY_DN15108_c0_g1_i1.p1  ORF type:complete len:409 (+),score=102.94 TRINITY_DN15108_c0_g1_i1:286-1512(+)